MSGQAIILQGNALNLPLPDESVDLIVTSPPYFALRSYRDAGEHYAGQIGSEPTPQHFLEALWAATAEMKRVLKPSGSIFVNLGDKYAGAGGGNNNSGITGRRVMGETDERLNPRNYNQATIGGARPKSLMGLPWRYAIGCIDQLDLILRAEIVWSKPNGLPESVKDRVRRSHEQWFHFTKEGIYFAAVDEVREPHSDSLGVQRWQGRAGVSRDDYQASEKDGLARPSMTMRDREYNELGKLPGSVWTIATEPLKVPEHLGVDHFAAFPTEWPRRFVLGWSPTGICTQCGDPRRPVVSVEQVAYRPNGSKTGRPKRQDLSDSTSHGMSAPGYPQTTSVASITGYVCACPEPTAETRPAVVLDPFGGTGTTALVAKTLDRIGISVDLSGDYCKLARWRCDESGHGRKALGRTWAERQEGLAL